MNRTLYWVTLSQSWIISPRTFPVTVVNNQFHISVQNDLIPVQVTGSGMRITRLLFWSNSACWNIFGHFGFRRLNGGEVLVQMMLNVANQANDLWLDVEHPVSRCILQVQGPHADCLCYSHMGSCCLLHHCVNVVVFVLLLCGLCILGLFQCIEIVMLIAVYLRGP